MVNTKNEHLLLTEIREPGEESGERIALGRTDKEVPRMSRPQQASTALARAFSLQGSGDPVYAQSDIWPIPAA